MLSDMPPPTPHPSAGGPLADAMVTLAGTPDHSASVDGQLIAIAHLTVQRVTAASYASITALRNQNYTTVAMSHDLVKAIDEAQYADNTGPCLNAWESGVPVAVPDIDATVQWPRFHEAAPRMGLRASISVPLHAGRGETIAVLNVYGHDRAAMEPLIAGILVAHGHPAAQMEQEQAMTGLDAGGREMVAGYAEALSIRTTIRFAIELIRSDSRCSADDAYLSLCIYAGEAGTDLAEAATKLIGDRS
jgi:hypothetical protein